MTRNDIDIIDGIVDIILNSEGWEKATKENDNIQEAEELVSCILRRLPKEQSDDFYEAYCEGVYAYTKQAILYGIHAAEILRKVAAEPSVIARV